MMPEAASPGVVQFGREVMAMEFVRKSVFEKAWIITSVLFLVAHRLLEASATDYDDSVSLLQVLFGLAMIVFSFPLGSLSMYVLENAVSWCDGCAELEWMLDWSTLLFAGYIQWFWVMPQILRNRKLNRNLTLLDLKRPPETVSPNASAATAEPATASFGAAPPAALEAAPLPAFDVAAFASGFPEFDEAGLTALGRVFQAQSPPPAPASPSHVEAIFPRVS